MNIFEELLKTATMTGRIAEQSRDNLFNADHRNKMIKEYGYTEAQKVTIEDLING